MLLNKLNILYNILNKKKKKEEIIEQLFVNT